MSNQIERRAFDKQGNCILSEEQRRNPGSLIPDDMPAEFRALAMANIRGSKEEVQAAHELIGIAEEHRQEEFRDSASQRLAELRAAF